MVSGRRPVEPFEKPYLAAFGARLAVLRREAGATQETLAFEAQLSRWYVCDLERGRCRTRASTIERLAAALERFSDGALKADDVAAQLTEEIGPALAAESQFAAVLAERRANRQRRIVSRWTEEDSMVARLAEEIKLEAARLIEEGQAAAYIAEARHRSRKASKYDQPAQKAVKKAGEVVRGTRAAKRNR